METLTRREQPDRSKINIHQADELKCWTRTLKVTREELLAAVDKVGDSAGPFEKSSNEWRPATTPAREIKNSLKRPLNAREKHVIERRSCLKVR